MKDEGYPHRDLLFANERNDERMKGVIRFFLQDLLDEYRRLHDRLQVYMSTPPHYYELRQLQFYADAVKVLHEIIHNRLKPSPTHARKAQKIDQATGYAPATHSPEGDRQ